VVPESYGEATIRIPVEKETKRATFLAAITADGTRLRPLIIVNRETCEAERFQIGYTPEKVLYPSQENGFITAELFAWWAPEVLFPHITAAREKLQYTGHAVVILDGWTSHGSDDFLDECTHRGTETLFLPSHSSDLTQPLDLGLFNLEKAKAARTKPMKELNPQTRQVIKALHGYQKACCPNHATSAFRRVGIITYWSVQHHALLARVERRAAVNIRHWLPDKRRIPVHGNPQSDEE
jgi:hypothetical protein